MGRTGNSAFDAYREETLRRLEEERDAFVAFYVTCVLVTWWYYVRKNAEVKC